jgi:hypothetical protein
VRRSSSRIGRTIAVAACASTLMTMVGAAPARAAAGTPRLFAQYSEITLHRHNTRPVFLNAGVFVAAVGGDLEFHVGRDGGYASPITASQWADGSKVQDLDPSLIDGWLGLAGFLHVQIKNPAGTVIEDRDMTWCPGGYGMQRVDDSGPDIQRLPQLGCYAMPFTLGTVWGIDQGWAAPVSDRYGSSEPVYISGHDGAYRVTYSFPRPVAEAFGIPRDDRMAKVTVHVETTKKSGHTAARAAAAPASDAAPAVPIDLNPDPSTVPDLIPLPAFDMRIYHRRGGGDFLAFGANIWSAGPSPMDVEGFRRPDSDVMDAYEYFYDGDTPVGRAPVGTFEFDDRKGHHHWHMEQFARYSLLNADQSEVVLSEKQSFCLAPTDPIDLRLPTAEWQPSWFGGGGLSTACGGSDAIWIREVLPVGWGDTYYQYVAGQSFDITHLPNGRYYVQVQANPTGSMIETTQDNNVSLRRVILRGKPGDRRVVVPAYMGIDSEACWYCYRSATGQATG